MAERTKGFTKGTLAVIITSLVICLVFAALLILNTFIPLKYFTSYAVKAHKNEEGNMRVTFIDVGFGESILVELPDGRNMLIDGGSGSYKNNLSLLEAINRRGIKVIDYLVCTSVKDEHCTGLAEIVKYKTVKKAFVPNVNNTRITDEYHSFISAVNKKNIPTEIACVSAGEEGDDYFFTFLSPSDYRSPQSEYTVLNGEPTNANIERASAMVWLEYGGTSFAFVSDARADTFKRVVEDYKLHEALGTPYCALGEHSVVLPECDVVSVACHGGEDNTYAPWYDLVKPKEAVVNVGENYSTYPSAMALSDVCQYAQPLYTMYDGNITFIVNADGYTVLKEKK